MGNEPYIIDRLTPLDLFEKMLGGEASHRILRIAGGAKMGKSHLLKTFYRRAFAEFQCLCAIVELGEKLPDPQSVLFSLKAQLPNLDFRNYDQTLDANPKQTIEIKDTKVWFSNVSAQITENQKNEIDRQRKLTGAFVDDLKANEAQQVFLCFDTIDHAPDLHNWFQQEFLSSLCQLNHLSIVVAGRELPDNPINLQMQCQDHDLEPFGIDHYKEVRERLDLDLDDEKVEFLFKLFDGKPGPMFEAAPKFRRSVA